MPPKVQLTRGRAEQLGQHAAEQATLRLEGESLHALPRLSCTFRGLASGDEVVDVSGPIATRAQLVYEWQATGVGVQEALQTRVKANHASMRGVPFPKTWTTALRCQDPASLTGQAVQHWREASGLADLSCRLLGPAKMKAVVDSGPMQEGYLAMLQTGETVMAYVLCAHIQDNLWLCHRGAFNGEDNVNMADPFNECSLVPGNVM